MFACLYRPVASLWTTRTPAVEPARPGFGAPSAGRAGEPAEALARLARDFSPRIEIHDEHLVLLDVSGVGRLFGDVQALGAALREAAADRGLRLHVALATTRTAAVLMAVARAGLTVVPPGREAATLAPLPLRMLHAGTPDPHRARVAGGASLPGCGADRHLGRHGADPGPVGRRRPRGAGSRHYRLAPAPEVQDSAAPSVVTSRAAAAPSALRIDPQARRPTLADDREHDALVTLARWGIATLGDLAALPPGDLFERLGEAGLALQKRARGEDAVPLVPDVELDPFEASLDLEWPIEGLEPLSFALGRLLEQVSVRLAQADCGAAVLHVRLRLVTKETHARSLQLPAPFRDPRVLRTLAMLDLESHPPAAGIDRVTVAIDPAPGQIVQFSLLHGSRPAPGLISTLLARLQALMGDDRCGAATLVDTHRAGAVELQRFTGEAPTVEDRGTGVRARTRILAAAPGPRPARVLALRRFRVPVAATVRTARGRPVHVVIHRRGFTGGRVEQCAGPWRTSGDWWRGAASTAPWNRDEWDVALGDGGVYRIFQDRDRGCWEVEGVVD